MLFRLHVLLDNSRLQYSLIGYTCTFQIKVPYIHNSKCESSNIYTGFIVLNGENLPRPAMSLTLIKPCPSCVFWSYMIYVVKKEKHYKTFFRKPMVTFTFGIVFIID